MKVLLICGLKVEILTQLKRKVWGYQRVIRNRNSKTSRQCNGQKKGNKKRQRMVDKILLRINDCAHEPH